MNWQALHDELAHWQRQGDIASLWWRDDDAQAPGPALARLNRLSLDFEIPLALAVIPEGVSGGLSRLFSENSRLWALQHGFRHHNRAPAGERKRELVDDPALLAELEAGRQALRRLFGGRYLPVMVPPWNRIDRALITRLAGLGFAGLSTLGARTADQESGLVVANVHVDLINWREGRRFAGEDVVLDQLIGHLRRRRLGEVDATEPTGLMTHHLAHDEATWEFLARLLAFTTEQPVRWLEAPAVFACAA